MGETLVTLEMKAELRKQLTRLLDEWMAQPLESWEIRQDADPPPTMMPPDRRLPSVSVTTTITVVARTDCDG
jgi:hypothetical protein